MGAYSIGPIPDWTINDWCDRHGYDDDVAEWFAMVMHIVDADTLERQRHKASEPRKRRR